MVQRKYETPSEELSQRELAEKFICAFCTADLDSLELLLTPDFNLRGPLFSFKGREAFLTSLQRDTLDVTSYDLIWATEFDDQVLIQYIYHKPSGSLTISQAFRFNKHKKIIQTMLAFDV